MKSSKSYVEGTDVCEGGLMDGTEVNEGTGGMRERPEDLV